MRYITHPPHNLNSPRRVRFLKVLGFRARRRWLKPFTVRVFAVERLSVGRAR
jgi:hypothetical protein